MRVWLRALVAVLCCGSTTFAGEVRLFQPAGCEPLLDANASRVLKDNYEFKVAEEYLRRCRAPGEDVILASRFGEWDMPAFDAVLVGPDRARLANISIKGIRVSGDNALVITEPRNFRTTILRLVKRANSKVKVWSEAGPWDRLTRHKGSTLAERLRTHPTAATALKKQFLDAALDLFSIPFSATGVRTQIVVAITDALGEPMFIDDARIPRKEIQHIISGTPGVESVVIVRNGAPITIASRYRAAR